MLITPEPVASDTPKKEGHYFEILLEDLPRVNTTMTKAEGGIKTRIVVSTDEVMTGSHPGRREPQTFEVLTAAIPSLTVHTEEASGNGTWKSVRP